MCGHALQGKSPFPFALAELVDNSLRAVQQARRPHGQITVSMVVNSLSSPTGGLLSVWDNGEGMTKQQLSQWAVMNLSMEDKGCRPKEGSTRANVGVGRFLAGNLSYFGVRQMGQAVLYCMSCLYIGTAFSLHLS